MFHHIDPETRIIHITGWTEASFNMISNIFFGNNAFIIGSASEKVQFYDGKYSNYDLIFLQIQYDKMKL